MAGIILSYEERGLLARMDTKFPASTTFIGNWRLAYRVYPKLKRLEQHGLVVRHKTAFTGPGCTAMWLLTEEGVHELTKWDSKP